MSRPRFALALVSLCACADAGPAGLPWPEATTQGPTASEIAGIALPGDWPFADTPEAAAQRAFLERAYVDLGVRYLRFEQLWHQWEPEPGSILTADADRKLDHAERAGLSPVIILDYGNPWANANDCVSAFAPNNRCAPDDLGAFAAYAGAMAERYAGRVGMWEVWNEPNHPVFWVSPTGVPQPDVYADLLVGAAAALRAWDDAPVAFAGTLYQLDAVEFVAAAYAARPALASAFDVMALHPYMSYPPSEPPEASLDNVPITDKIAELRAAMAAAGDHKPIAITELGWATYPWPTLDRVDEREQASWLVRSFVHALSEGVEMLAWFTMLDQDPSSQCNTFLPEHCFGLFFHDADPLDGVDPEPKEAFVAYKHLLATLGDLRIERSRVDELELDFRQFAWQLVGPRRLVTVLWAYGPAATGRVVSVPLHENDGAELRDVLGNVLKSPVGEAVEITLEEEPVFLVETR